jgi:hypothetical protein
MAWFDTFRGKSVSQEKVLVAVPTPEDDRSKRLEVALQTAKLEAQVVSILKQVDTWLKDKESSRDNTQSGKTQWQLNQERMMKQSIAGRAASNPIREAVLKYASAQDKNGSEPLLALLAEPTLKQSVMEYLQLKKLEARAQFSTVSDLYRAIHTTGETTSIESLVTPVSVSNIHAEKMDHLDRIKQAVERLQSAGV